MLGTFCYMANYVVLNIVILIISSEIDELQDEGKSRGASDTGAVIRSILK